MLSSNYANASQNYSYLGRFQGRSRFRALARSGVALGLVLAGMTPAFGRDSGADEPEKTESESGDAVELPALDVTAQKGRTVSAVGTKTDTPLIETPQSIGVVPTERALEQGAQNIQETLRYTTGVRTESYGLDQRGDWGFIRGFDPTLYQDGMRQLYGYYNTPRTDIYTLERVEVLRGPASVLYGQGTIGGIVNLVSKRPVFGAFGGEVTASYGTFEHKQLQADVTGSLTADQTLAGRVIGVLRDSETQVDHVDDDRLLLAPSLTWRPTSRTELTLLAVLQEDDGGSTAQFLPHSGRIKSNPNGHVPSSRYIGEPDFEEYDTQKQSIGYAFSHAFNEALTFRQNFRQVWSKISYQSTYPNVYDNPADPFTDANDRILDRYFYVKKASTRVLTQDSQVEAHFDTGTISHKFLFGVDYQRFREISQMGFDYPAIYGGTATPIDLYNPVYGNYVYPALYAQPDNVQTQLGVYAQDIVSIGEHINLMLGGRHDNATNKVQGTPDQDDRAWTSRFGIIGKNLLFGLAPYFSYAEAFLPVIGTDAYGNAFKPQEGRQYEVGVKWQPEPTSPFFATLALYDMKDTNRLVTDPKNPLFSIQAGEVKTRGVEIEASAWVAKDYEVIFSYAFTKAQDDDLQLESVPKHTGSIWVSRYFDLADNVRLQLGAGVRHTGPSWDGSNTLKTPYVTLVDGLVATEIGPWRFAVNGNNLLDEDYDATCLARGDCFVGSRRTVIGSATYRF